MFCFTVLITMPWNGMKYFNFVSQLSSRLQVITHLMSTTVQKYIFTDSFKTTLLTGVETWTFLLRSWVRVDWSSCCCSMTAGFAANFDTTWQFWTSLISVAQLQCNRHRNIDTVHHCRHFICHSQTHGQWVTFVVDEAVIGRRPTPTASKIILQQHHILHLRRARFDITCAHAVQTSPNG